MQHVILATYILIFSAGFAGIASLAVLALRVRSRLILPFIIMQSIFLAALGLVAVYFYFSNVLGLIGGDYSGSSMKVIALVSVACTILMYAMMLRIMHLLVPRPPRRSRIAVLKTVASVLILLVIIVMTAGSLLNMAGRETLPTVLFISLSVAIYALSGLAVPAFGLTLLWAPVTGEHSAVRLLLKGVGWCSICFAPLSAIEYVLEKVITLPWHPLSIEFLLFSALTVVMIVAGIRSLTGNGAVTAVFEGVSPDTAARFALTARECDMAGMIGRGMTNKEIAWELNISPATVRTHIYNLYQKVGVQSRIDLLNKLRSD